jgi:hypothetical protein
MMVTRGSGRDGNGEVVFNRYRVATSNDEKFLEMDKQVKKTNTPKIV